MFSYGELGTYRTIIIMLDHHAFLYTCVFSDTKANYLTALSHQLKYLHGVADLPPVCNFIICDILFL